MLWNLISVCIIEKCSVDVLCYFKDFYGVLRPFLSASKIDCNPELSRPEKHHESIIKAVESLYYYNLAACSCGTQEKAFGIIDTKPVAVGKTISV